MKAFVPIVIVIGGIYWLSASGDRLQALSEALDPDRGERLGEQHCTGMAAAELLRHRPPIDLYSNIVV